MKEEEFQRLTTRYLEGALNENELEMLGYELSGCQERVKEFNDIRLLAGLIHEHGQNAPNPEFRLKSAAAIASPGWVKSRWIFLAAQASLAASILLAIVFLPRFFAPTPVAKLISGENASWESALPTTKGSDLAAGLLDLKTGMATVQFRSGVDVSIQGPARLELITPMRGRILSGRARIDVPESAIGFIMETPNGYAVDHGTEFSVSVDPSNDSSSFKVLDGEISVYVSSTGENARLRGVGKAITVESNALVTGKSIEPELGPEPGPRTLIVGTGGREGTAIRNDKREFIQPKFLTVNRLLKKQWDRQSFFAFDLSNVNFDEVDSVLLRLNLVPFPYGLFSSLPEFNQYAVYGITNPEKADWDVECRWQDSPRPEDGVILGTFDVPRSQQHGSFVISNKRLLQFLMDREATEVTFVIQRQNLPLKTNDVPCHAFAGVPHPEASEPKLEFTLKHTLSKVDRNAHGLVTASHQVD
ncbi:FecR family protein [Neorhodopirellula lusitana]|uniref:FecR family protein n=1 Tax=Neorhodopirellula lusitana TaxID=445327 RepID=A0ABY1QRJ2_9BACT|nr:FecR domain-containing protein [Neorhodopirellula lusitana]SMP78882.1 FecR family protein [Neorhodopirellula lusitana]